MATIERLKKHDDMMHELHDRSIPKFYSAYDTPKVKGISFEGQESLTKQSFKDACDINKILANYDGNMLAEAQMRNPGFYGDFIDAEDYRTALSKITEAESLFEALPAEIRTRFNNDPASFLAFAQDYKNTDELVAMRLASYPASGRVEPKAPETST